jgi:hypothetical protein
MMSINLSKSYMVTIRIVFAVVIFSGCNIIGNNPQSEVESRLNEVAFIEMHNGMYGPERGRILYYHADSLDDPSVIAREVYGFHPPAVSFDMRYIAYLKMPPGQTRYPRNIQLVVKDFFNGSVHEPVLEWISYYSFQMSWSPDGSSLLITDTARSVDGVRRPLRLLLYHPATGEMEVLIEDEVFRSPEWSPRGDAISYIRYAEEDARLPAYGVILDLSTRTRTVITPPGIVPITNLKWSPNGRFLAFIEVHERKYYVSTLTRDGTAFRRRIKMGSFLRFDDFRFPGFRPGISADPSSSYAVTDWIHWLPNGNELYVVWQDNARTESGLPYHRRVIITLSSGHIREFMPSMVFNRPVQHFPATGLSITAGKKSGEILPHFYVADDYGRGAVQLRFSGSSNGIVIVPRPTIRRTQ